jgi:hypothetical protein
MRLERLIFSVLPLSVALVSAGAPARAQERPAEPSSAASDTTEGQPQPEGQPVSRPASRPASSTPVGPEAAQARLTLIFEIDEHHLKVQEMWQIRNTGSGKLPASALVFPLGEGVRRLALDEESQADFDTDDAGTVISAKRGLPAGESITLAGSYLLDLAGRGRAQMARRFPVPVFQGRAILEHADGISARGSTRFSSRIRDLNGRKFEVFDFGGLSAGHDFRLEFRGLPSRTTLPRDITIALCLAAFGWMIFALARGRGAPQAAPVWGALAPEARREQLVRALELLEEDRASGRVEGRPYERRRKELLGELAGVLREIELRQPRGT